MRRAFAARAGPALVAGLALLLAACGTTPPVAVESRPDPVAPRVKSKRVFVISQIAKADPQWAAAFAPAIRRELGRAGATAAVQTRDPLAVQSDRDAYAGEIEKFAPEAWLIVVPGDGTVDRDGRQLSRRFEAGLFRRGKEGEGRDLVWRASMLLKPSGAWLRPSDMDRLAGDLVKKLREDGLLGAPRRASRPPGGGSPVSGGYKQEGMVP